MDSGETSKILGRVVLTLLRRVVLTGAFLCSAARHQEAGGILKMRHPRSILHQHARNKDLFPQSF